MGTEIIHFGPRRAEKTSRQTKSPTLFRDPFFNVEIRSSAFCGMLEINSPLLELSSLIFFLLPFFIMVYLYICMSIKIRKSTKIILGCDRHELDKRHKNRRAILKMLGNKSKVMLQGRTKNMAGFVLWFQRLLEAPKFDLWIKVG